MTSFHIFHLISFHCLHESCGPGLGPLACQASFAYAHCNRGFQLNTRAFDLTKFLSSFILTLPFFSE